MGNEPDYEELRVRVKELEEKVSKFKRDRETPSISEPFLDSLMEQSPNAMWISDKDGTLIKVNSSCLKLLNIKREEIVGKYNILKDNVVEEQGVMPLVRSVYEEGKNVKFNIRYDSSKLESIDFDTELTCDNIVRNFPRLVNVLVSALLIEEPQEVGWIDWQTQGKKKTITFSQRDWTWFESCNV